MHITYAVASPFLSSLLFSSPLLFSSLLFHPTSPLHSAPTYVYVYVLFLFLFLLLLFSLPFFSFLRPASSNNPNNPPEQEGGGGDSEVQRTMLELLAQLDGFEATQSIKVSESPNPSTHPSLHISLHVYIHTHTL